MMMTVSNIACILLLLSSICNYLYCITIDGIDYTESGHTLNGNIELHSRSALISLDRRFALAIHPNGNLILYFISTIYNNYGEILWQTNTNQGDQKYDRFLIYQPSDGNLVLYTKQSGNTQRALWATDKQHDNTGYVVLQNDGNLVVRGHDTQFQWGLLNTYSDIIIPASSYSKAGPPPGYKYNNLVTYIPHDGQTYQQAKAAKYEWCLSAGMIGGIPVIHDLNEEEHNLYWCDNYITNDYNQHCNCLGLYHDSDEHLNYIINGKTYILERDWDEGRGNKIDNTQWNLKSDPDGSPDSFEWTDDELCHRWTREGKNDVRCCIEWEETTQLFIDLIDRKSRVGREAKCAEDGQADLSEGVQEKYGGDPVEWKFKLDAIQPKEVPSDPVDF